MGSTCSRQDTSLYELEGEMARKFTGTDTSIKFHPSEKDKKEKATPHEPSKAAAPSEEINGSG